MERLTASAGAGSVLAAAGPDLYQSGRLAGTAVDRFREGLGFDVLRRDAGELGAGDLKRILIEGSLFASGHLLVLSEAHRLGKSSSAELLESIENGLSDSAVFLSSTAVPRESALLRKLEKLVPFYICYEPFERDVSGWISRLASEEGISFDREAVGLLSQYAGRNLQRLSDAVTRLALFHGPGRKIDGGGVREVLAGKGGMDIFQLGDMLFAGRRGDALDCAVNLVSSGEEPVAILAYLYSTWQKVVATEEILDRGGGKREVTAETGARFPLLDKLIAFASTDCRCGVAEAAEAFAQADHALKTGGDVTAVFAALIFTLTRGSR